SATISVGGGADVASVTAGIDAGVEDEDLHHIAAAATLAAAAASAAATEASSGAPTAVQQSWLFTEGLLGEKMSTVVEGSGQIRGLFVDPKLQLHLLLAFNNPAADLNPREITSFSLRKILSLYSTEVSNALQQHFDSEDVLEIARTLVGHTIMAIFKSQFERDGLTLSDALTGAFISTFAQIAATCSPKVHLTQQTICQLTKNLGVKQLLLEASPETVLSVMDIAKRILVLDPPGGDANADASGNVRTTANVAGGTPTTAFASSFSAKFTIPRLDATDAFNDAEEAQLFSENGLRRAFALYHAITNEIAHLHVDVVTQDPKSYLLHVQALTTLESHSVTLNSLTKHQVLYAMTTPDIRKMHSNKSLLELL
ncbi:MAG: hypothetical protein Q8J97_03085, partial [Flavobacteriaceae bacterium]|nr:hypothetical protein [Flavobacteriaceae bacterium]